MRKLNIPILKDLEPYNNILIIGVGGGFDIYCGLPLYHDLMLLEKDIVLANYSFTNFEEAVEKTESELILPNLILNKSFKEPMSYNPEGYLFQGIKESYGFEQKIYSIKRDGQKPTIQAIEKIIKDGSIDCIIAIDGGIDSIMYGNELGCGTILEDTITCEAINRFEIPAYLVCIGLTTEIEEQVCNYTAFKRISEHIAEDSLLGTCSLLKNMSCFTFFKNLCLYCWNQPGHKSSHISSRIIPAAEGKFDEYENIFYSFLMTTYFFFSLRKVIEKNVIKDHIKETQTFSQAIFQMKQNRQIKEGRKELKL